MIPWFVFVSLWLLLLDRYALYIYWLIYKWTDIGATLKKLLESFKWKIFVWNKVTVYFEYRIEWNFWIVTQIMAASIANYQDVSQSNCATHILK